MFKRINKQLDLLVKEINSHQIQNIQIISIQDKCNPTFSIAGPLGSPYQGYWFRIEFKYPLNYPLTPPQVKFIDQIWNPYVDFKNNTICMDILDKQYCPQLTSQTILLSIISLLSQTKIQNKYQGFMNPSAAVEMMNNYPCFYDHARRQSETRAYMRKQIYDDSLRGKEQEHIIKVEKQKLKNVTAFHKNNPPQLNYENNHCSEKILLYNYLAS